MNGNAYKVLIADDSSEFSKECEGLFKELGYGVTLCKKRGDIEVLSSYFGYTVNAQKGKPTNSEFVAMVADKIRLRLDLENIT